MSLFNVSASGLSDYAEHSASAQAHYTVAKNLGRTGNFHDAATAHYNQAVQDRNSAKSIVKSSPQSNDFSYDSSSSYHAGKAAFDQRQNN
jgi:hypothetical protein